MKRTISEESVHRKSLALWLGILVAAVLFMIMGCTLMFACFRIRSLESKIRKFSRSTLERIEMIEEKVEYHDNLILQGKSL